MLVTKAFQIPLMVCITVCMLGTGAALADVRLPRLVSDHMVLQRDSQIIVRGWADPGEKIQIHVHGQYATANTNRLGQWSTAMGPFAAGGPYDIIVRGKNTIEVHDVLIGDVWVASGQSNMEFPVNAVDNADRELAGAHFSQIRLFLVERNAALKPADYVMSKAGWRAVTPESVANFSAVAYFFGRGLHQRYHVPIGMIESNWGGTAAEAWMSSESLKSFPEFNEAIDTVRRANDKTAVADFDRYKQEKAAWYGQHAADDRGLLDGHAIWADPAFDISAWPTIVEPQTKGEEALKGFDGAVWFRREIIIPAGQEGKSVQVHLTGTGPDITYFNGEKIGETKGWDKPRDYAVPAQSVRAGRNVIAIRITGSDGVVGMFDSDNPDKMNVEVGSTTTLPLAGAWSYQPGPDLGDLPAPPQLAKLNNDPTATVLFNGMIHPLLPFKIRGVIWYQGEANAMDNRSVQYRKLFPTLIDDWREHWGYEVPFLFVQLAGFGHNKPEPADYPWAELREAQSMTLSLPGTGMATAIDIGDENDIHPKNKQEVARRLVLAAAAKAVYGENVVYSGPTYQSMQIERNQVRIRFSNLGSGLLIKDRYGYARGFEIAAADGKYRWAQARQEGTDVLVFNDSIQHPVSVRYDWSNTPDGNLFNAEGLPAIPFRTDAPKELNASR